jgi:hypothetical protein
LPVPRPLHAAPKRDPLDAVFRACIPCLNKVANTPVATADTAIILPDCKPQAVMVDGVRGEDKDSTTRCEFCATKRGKSCVQVRSISNRSEFEADSYYRCHR